MRRVKIFYRKDCPFCPLALNLKKSLIEEKVNVEFYDIDTAEGLAEATFHKILSVPTVIVEDNMENEVRKWHGSVPSLSEVLNAVKSG